MNAEADPWGRYSRTQVEAGRTFPLGREQVRSALVGAGAFVDQLTFSGYRRPDPAHPVGLPVLSLRWSSDARSGYITAQDTALPKMWMTLYAVPSDLRAMIRQGLLERWLNEACSWVAISGERGNAWSASKHEWALWWRGEDFACDKT